VVCSSVVIVAMSCLSSWIMTGRSSGCDWIEVVELLEYEWCSDLVYMSLANDFQVVSFNAATACLIMSTAATIVDLTWSILCLSVSISWV